jgi:hypothetical protein
MVAGSGQGQWGLAKRLGTPDHQCLATAKAVLVARIRDGTSVHTMPLAGLIDADLKSYIAENRGNDRCWFFVHIPKTAGSSFRRELADVLRPNHNVHVDRSRQGQPHGQKLIAATQAFNQRLKERPCRFASGHVPITMLAAHVDIWRDLKLITMLREPGTRVVSDYRYQTTPAHPTHREFIERFPTFESYLSAPRMRNRMFNFLRPSQKATLDECIAFIVERFSFVGVVEMYPMSVRLVTRLMEQERSPSRYVRKTVDNEFNQVEVTPELLEQVRELNSLDVALYDYFYAKLRDVRDQVFTIASVETENQPNALGMAKP